MPNTRNRTNLKGQMDLLSDAHAEITALAAEINSSILKVDNPEKAFKAAFTGKYADRRMGELLELLEEQAMRTHRVLAEVRAIKKNIKLPGQTEFCMVRLSVTKLLNVNLPGGEKPRGCEVEGFTGRLSQPGAYQCNAVGKAHHNCLVSVMGHE